MAKREKKVHRVRPDLTYEDDIHFKLAKLKLLKDLSEERQSIIDEVKAEIMAEMQNERDRFIRGRNNQKNLSLSP